MSIAGISSSRGSINVKKSSHDSYEISIKKQINELEEKMKAISDDEEKPAQQKAKEKQAAQEQLQNLNQELREYQVRKQQEEAAKRQEAIKESLADTEDTARETTPQASDGRETGVMITLSSAHEQLAGMVRLRTRLEGKQRTAETEEEKADLQKKINNLSSGIGKKMATAKDTLASYQKTSKKAENRQHVKMDLKKEEVFWTDAKPSAGQKTLMSDKTKPFDRASYNVR